jgi:hypothetical protein
MFFVLSSLCVWWCPIHIVLCFLFCPRYMYGGVLHILYPATQDTDPSSLTPATQDTDPSSLTPATQDIDPSSLTPASQDTDPSCCSLQK